LLAELRQSNPAVGYSHPAWLVERWVQRWGLPQTQQLLDWNNTPPRTYARLNTLRVEGSRLLDRWRQEEDVEYDFGRWEWLPENLVFALKSHPPLAGLGTFKEGCFYVQDPSTLLAVHLVDPKPGDAILDLCAAPGGKTTYLAQLMGNQGIVVAEDASVPRLELLRENCARLGATCVLIRPAADRLPEEHRPWAEDHPLELPGAGPFGGGGVSEPRAQPPRQPPISPPPKAMSVSVTRGPCPTLFDKVLVDAPCSNTGVMRRRVDLRWRVRPEELSRLQSLQLGLLERAASRLRAGGTLVYGTCSLEPEENAAVVSTFLSQRRDYRLDHERALTPVTDHVDGAYTARLRHAA
jgi:16S rRNA (cytosine967-C5)-methyltransferase